MRSDYDIARTFAGRRVVESATTGMEVYTASPVDRVRASLSEAAGHGSPVAFQSTVATAIRAVSRALASERAAEDAALSLAQRHMLASLRAQLESTEEVLEQALSERGRCLIDEPRRQGRLTRLLNRRGPEGQATSWQTAVREAVDVLGGGAEVLTDLAHGQPAEAPARVLAESIAHLLEEHQERLEDAAVRS